MEKFPLSETFDPLTPRTTMERLITIVVMLLGVVSFTFVVSNINSIISQNKKKVKLKSKNLICLENIQRDHKLSDHMISMIKKEIKRTQDIVSLEQFKEMILKFPKKMQDELFLGMFHKSLTSINMFKSLPNEVLILLGKSLKSVIYMPSM